MWTLRADEVLGTSEKWADHGSFGDVAVGQEKVVWTTST